MAANLGMAGINVLAAPMVTMSMRICSVLPLPPWTVVDWWVIIRGWRCGGYEAAPVYESWAVRRGFRAWSVLAWGEDDVVYTSMA